jgi:hypothetical protein
MPPSSGSQLTPQLEGLTLVTSRKRAPKLGRARLPPKRPPAPSLRQRK